MSAQKLTFAQKAQAAWGTSIPPEVVTLAEFADSRSGAEAAKAIGYSPAVVSHLIANRYPGDLPTVMQKIRGALMGETVLCPVLGELGRDQCLTEQRRPFAATTAARAQVYRACRTGCPHSRLKGA
ncbi:transcriptional regulator [Methylorubrum populi]|uniref:transcriptional regulator n=1 Tax=Methylorubrum populi TaxID=223967 RepID=UPI000DB014AA|nr:transcriptional regulator [Methylorubrum populi]PZP67130.1 MAG: transcriptional regulator [Methylorubrum populi]